MKRWVCSFLLCGAMLGFSGCSLEKPEPARLNFAHLLYLTEPVKHGPARLEIVHIYSEYPDYGWVDAEGEGTACVDDASRAAVLWLRQAQRERTGEAELHARRLLRFLLYMQRKDGRFVNFVDRRLERNLTGRTSRPCLCWWTARAAWAISEGLEYFRPLAPEFADSLAIALVRIRGAVDSMLAAKGMWEVTPRGRYPAWLIAGTGADASAVLTLALLKGWNEVDCEWAESAARAILDGIQAMQIRNPADSLYGAVLSYRDLWHAWGANQLYALVRGWDALGDSRYLAAAELEARYWWGRLLVRGSVHEVNLVKGTSSRYPQIAYDIRPATWGLLELARATGDTLWSVAAGLWASWLLGNNDDGFQMYDARTGRCYDGILGPGRLNRNSGAESTIEALLALQAVRSDSAAARALSARWTQRWIEGGRTFRLAETPSGVRYLLAYDPKRGLSLVPGSERSLRRPTRQR